MSISPGIRSGPRPGTRSGVDQRYVKRDGPNNWYTPESTQDFVTLRCAVPDFFWNCGEASGNLSNAIGSALSLAANATGHLYQQSVTRWTRKFLGTDGTTANQSWRTSSAALDLAVGQSAALVGLASLTTPASSTRGLMTISNSNNINASAPGGLLRTNHAGIVVNGAVAQGGLSTVHQLCWYRNAATNVSGALSDTDAVTGTHNEDVFSGEAKGLGAVSPSVGTGVPPEARFGWFAIYLGSNAERDWAAFLAVLRGG